MMKTEVMSYLIKYSLRLLYEHNDRAKDCAK